MTHLVCSHTWTILFCCSICTGFDAWSSQREPSQCLTLLETVYRSFDRLAKEQSITKVEAVPDSVSFASGMPDEREDHAEAMVRFANDCLKSFRETTKALEQNLGPETSELCMRFGVHSGSVTALRGGRSRFQVCIHTVSNVLGWFWLLSQHALIFYFGTLDPLAVR